MNLACWKWISLTSLLINYSSLNFQYISLQKAMHHPHLDHVPPPSSELMWSSNYFWQQTFHVMISLSRCTCSFTLSKDTVGFSRVHWPLLHCVCPPPAGVGGLCRIVVFWFDSAHTYSHVHVLWHLETVGFTGGLTVVKADPLTSAARGLPPGTLSFPLSPSLCLSPCLTRSSARFELRHMQTADAAPPRLSLISWSLKLVPPCWLLQLFIKGDIQTMDLSQEGLSRS